MANFNFNKVILGGRLTADPELKTTPSGISVTSFTIAVNRRDFGKNDEKQADFFNVTAWRNTAEFITRYFRKASSICVVGSIQTRTWQGTDGQKKFATEIVADEAFFVDAKDEAPAAVQQLSQAYKQPSQQMPTSDYMAAQYQSMGQQAQQTAPMYEKITDSDELPF